MTEVYLCALCLAVRKPLVANAKSHPVGQNIKNWTHAIFFLSVQWSQFIKQQLQSRQTKVTTKVDWSTLRAIAAFLNRARYFIWKERNTL